MDEFARLGKLLGRGGPAKAWCQPVSWASRSSLAAACKRSASSALADEGVVHEDQRLRCRWKRGAWRSWAPWRVRRRHRGRRVCACGAPARRGCVDVARPGDVAGLALAIEVFLADHKLADFILHYWYGLAAQAQADLSAECEHGVPNGLGFHAADIHAAEETVVRIKCIWRSVGKLVGRLGRDEFVQPFEAPAVFIKSAASQSSNSG